MIARGDTRLNQRAAFFLSLVLWASAVSADETRGSCSPILREIQGDIQLRLSCPNLTPQQVQELKTSLKSLLDGQTQEQIRDLSKTLGIQEKAITTMLDFLGKRNPPLDKLEDTFMRIVAEHMILRDRVRTLESEEPRVTALAETARQAIEHGEYAHAQSLLDTATQVEQEAFRRAQEELNNRELNLAELAALQGRLALAKLDHGAAMEQFRQAADWTPDSEPLVRADYLNQRGLAALDNGAFNEAEDAFRQALSIRERQLRSHDPQIAQSLNNVAQALSRKGARDRAEDLFLTAIAIWEQQAEGRFQVELAASHNNVALLYQDEGKYAKAGTHFERSLEILEDARTPAHPNVAATKNNLALVLQAQGCFKLAEHFFLETLEELKTELGPGHPRVAQALNNLGVLYFEQERYDDAARQLQEALSIYQLTTAEEIPELATVYSNLALVLWYLERPGEAEIYHQYALDMRRVIYDRSHPEVARSLNNLGKLYYEMGRFEDAVPLYQQAQRIVEETLPDGHPLAGWLFYNRALLRAATEQDEVVENLFDQAVKIFEHSDRAGHPKMAQILRDYAKLLENRGHSAKAKALEAHAARIGKRRTCHDNRSASS